MQRHSTTAPNSTSESPAGCISVSHFLPSTQSSEALKFRGSSATKDRARLASLWYLSGRHRSLSGPQTTATGQDWSRALGDRPVHPRHSVLSPAVRKPCVGFTQLPGPQGEQKGPQSPREGAAGHWTITELGDTIMAVREPLPRRPALVRTWDPRGQGCAAWRPEPMDRGAGRAHSPAPLCSVHPALPNSGVGRPESRNGWREPSPVRRWRHTATPSRDGKTGTCDTELYTGTLTHSWPQAVAQVAPAVRGNTRTAFQL